MSYIIFDLEATCGLKYQNIRNEIIEIGAVKLSRDLTKKDTFCQFIKPIINPVLTEFCKNLTSITQKNVDNAQTFLPVIALFKEWIGEDYLLISWGAYDKKQLISDCDLHGCNSDWVYKHINFKGLYANKNNVRKMGMDKALSRENILPQGIHHRGIYDAINTSSIFVKGFKLWGL
jgi:inhibitor of KinA sporulation pathway (predicted exonuclease)